MYYKVIVEGNNFWLSSESQNSMVGFYTTFFVATNCVEEIRDQLEGLLSTRLKNNYIRCNKNFFNESYLLIDGIYTATKDDYSNQPDGFTFYNLSLLGRIYCYFKLRYLRIVSPEKLLHLTAL